MQARSHGIHRLSTVFAVALLLALPAVALAQHGGRGGGHGGGGRHGGGGHGGGHGGGRHGGGGHHGGGHGSGHHGGGHGGGHHGGGHHGGGHYGGGHYGSHHGGHSYHHGSHFSFHLGYPYYSYYDPYYYSYGYPYYYPYYEPYYRYGYGAPYYGGYGGSYGRVYPGSAAMGDLDLDERPAERDESVSPEEDLPAPGPARRPRAGGQQRQELRTDLRQEPGRLILDIGPADAAVYLDGRFVGTGEDLAKGLLVDPGSHVLEVLRPDRRNATRRLDVAPGAQVEQRIELERRELPGTRTAARQ